MLTCRQVKVTPIPGKKVDHQGIRVQLLGEIELASERGHPHEFVSLGEQRHRQQEPRSQRRCAGCCVRSR